MNLEPTASQTVGPYLHIGLCWLTCEAIAAADTPGEHVDLRARVLDADGLPISDALVEIWQADAKGRYVHPEDLNQPPSTGFRGFGRVPTDAQGRFAFHTIKPGPVADPEGGLQAPHLLVSVFMRGAAQGVVARMYFPEEPRNADDRVLRRCRRNGAERWWPGGVDHNALEWDIHMQGQDETVFFDC